MARRLGSFVHVRDEHGAMRRFGPDDDLPGWAASQVTNSAAWADAGTSSSSGGDEAPAAPAPKRPRKTKPREGSTQDAPRAESAQETADRTAAAADAREA